MTNNVKFTTNLDTNYSKETIFLYGYRFYERAIIPFLGLMSNDFLASKCIPYVFICEIEKAGLILDPFI